MLKQPLGAISTAHGAVCLHSLLKRPRIAEPAELGRWFVQQQQDTIWTLMLPATRRYLPGHMLLKLGLPGSCGDLLSYPDQMGHIAVYLKHVLGYLESSLTPAKCATGVVLLALHRDVTHCALSL